MKKSERVITFGVFDTLHYGHLLLFKKCKTLGDYLIVAVHKDEFVKVNKPDCNLVFNENERVAMVESIRYVDKVILYNQIDADLPFVDFDILAVGPDQTNEHFQKAISFARANGKKVVVLPRTENISSSLLRKRRNDAANKK